MSCGNPHHNEMNLSDWFHVSECVPFSLSFIHTSREQWGRRPGGDTLAWQQMYLMTYCIVPQSYHAAGTQLNKLIMWPWEFYMKETGKVRLISDCGVVSRVWSFATVAYESDSGSRLYSRNTVLWSATVWWTYASPHQSNWMTEKVKVSPRQYFFFVCTVIYFVMCDLCLLVACSFSFVLPYRRKFFFFFFFCQV